MGSRVVLGQAITLVESTLKADEEIASQLLDKILPHAGDSLRIGITGVPGVGKSTFIETFGEHLTKNDKKLAILTIDPSSQLTRGSILGDKTRMDSLSKNAKAFIRPTAAGYVLGGVANRTREAMLLCEACGFNVIIVETVGTGQSETRVKNMVDFFLLLLLAGAGDELQGIKKGIMEMADGVVVTKADGENIAQAKLAATEYQQALHLLQESANGWFPKVLTCSAIENVGIPAIWDTILTFENRMKANGYWQENRKQQKMAWLEEAFQHKLESEIKNAQNFREQAALIEKRVAAEEISVHHAATLLLQKFKDF